MKSATYETGSEGVHCSAGSHQPMTQADLGPNTAPGTAPVPHAIGTSDPVFAAAWRVLEIQPDAIREIRRELSVAQERWPDDRERREQHVRRQAAHLANLHARALDAAQMDLGAAIRSTRRAMDAHLADHARSPVAAQYRREFRQADPSSRRSMLQDVNICGFIAASRPHVSGVSEIDHAAIRADYFRRALPFESARLEALTDTLSDVTAAIAAFWSAVHAIVHDAAREAA